ncbi:metaxin-1-like isoform X1 [Varroa destructor]|uniref:Metaxin n=1 Tax=Varroa destructor TaxID=109461 RepID=A0A7M7KXS4_VARDE|nr:metaxin-1-like isoform X1 [Varroa destructor]
MQATAQIPFYAYLFCLQKGSNCSQMELTVWRGDWGLGSVSIDCLESLAYCKLAGALSRPVQHRKYIFTADLSATLWHSTYGKTVIGTPAIVSYLKKGEFDLDRNLSARERADILAYKIMVQHKLVPALNYAVWCDERNYAEVTRPAFARIVTFPLNYTVPGRLQRVYLDELWARFGQTANPQDVETRLNRDARECFLALSEKLGSSQYFFGNKATSFDAFLFARLSFVLKIPVPNANLVSHLKTFPNLVEFVNKIHNKHIASEVRKQRSSKERPEWIGIALSISFAATVMFYYAFAKGILQIEFEPTSGVSSGG